MFSATIRFLLFLIIVVTECTHGWSCPGHMIIAEIARRHLSERNAFIVELMAKEFSNNGPFPQSPDFVQLACWADDVKTWDMFAMNEWHYIDTPYNPEHINTSTIHKVEAMNVVSAINAMRTALQTNRSTNPYILHFALANLIHFVGDVHQPLHTTTRYSHKLPHGDKGGNKVLIQVNTSAASLTSSSSYSPFLQSLWVKPTECNAECKWNSKTCECTNHNVFACDIEATESVHHGNLHAFWDEMCDLTSSAHKTWHRPLTPDGYELLHEIADHFEDSNKFDPELYTTHSISSIAKESHKFAINTTYTCVDGTKKNSIREEEKKEVAGEEYVILTQDYVRECKRVVAQRITLAGRRFAYILNNIFDEYDIECEDCATEVDIHSSATNSIKCANDDSV